MRAPERAPDDEPVEHRSKHAAIEERARRERGVGVVQDEDHLAAPRVSHDGGKAGKEVVRAVREDDVRPADLSPQSAPASNRDRPGSVREIQRDIGCSRPPPGAAREHSDIPSVLSKQRRGGVDELFHHLGMR